MSRDAPQRAASTGSVVRLEGEEGREYHVTEAGLIVGRLSEFGETRPDVPLRSDGYASRRHARIYLEGGECWIEDLGSKHGTTVNGTAVKDGPIRLASGDQVMIGNQAIQVLGPGGTATDSVAPDPGQRERRVADERRLADEHRIAEERQAWERRGREPTRFLELADSDRLQPTAPAPPPLPYSDRPVMIGRAPESDLVLDDLNVSREHAVIEPGPSGPQLRDLGSRNGTRLAGELVQTAELRPGAEIGIGPYRLTFTGEEVRAVSEHGSLSVQAIGVSVSSNRRQILAPTYMSVRPGELVAIIGENGAGKTTLLKALAGVSRPSAGSVLMNGEPVAQRVSDIGYVPQNDTVHRWLTIEEALRFGARLRLPDATESEIQEAVRRAIETLQLEALRGQLIGSEEEKPRAGRLSGGERKRACVAMEMLNRPSVVFLDEPTSPLDPWFGKELLLVLRGLAESNCAVVMVTHHHDDVPLCDKVAVLARGGHLCYYGPPAGALDYFGVESYAEIYGQLRTRTGEEWSQAAGGEVPAERSTMERPVPRPTTPAPHRETPPVSLRAQTLVLARRYALLLRRDHANLAALTLSVPALALMFLVAFKRDVFVPSIPPGAPPGVHTGQTDAPTFLFFLTFVVILLGVIASFRELIKERAIFRRERAVGVHVRAYVASKYLVLGTVGILQAAALEVLAFAFHPLHQGAGAYIGIAVVLIITSLAGVGIGLAVSAVVKSQEQATSYISIPLALQLFFGGAIIHPLKGAMAVIAAFMPSRWSFAGLGTFAKLNGNVFLTAPNHFGAMFSHSPALPILILAIFPVALAALTIALVRRQRD